METNIKTKKVDKGTILLHQGDFCKYGYKVISGCLKSYIIDKTGKEHILQFAPEKWFISDLKSIIEKIPSTIFIEAVENSELELLHSEDFGQLDYLSKDELLQQNKSLFKNILASNQRIKLLLASTAEERYLDFIDTYPTLLQRLSLKLIASYLGMTPEYLSDVRKKIAQK